MSDAMNIMDHTSRIVAAYCGRNALTLADVPDVIATIYRSLEKYGQDAPEAPPAPAVHIRKSVRPDAILCLECGKPQKVLKRHLATAHGLTPDDYRAKWGLPADYPTTSPGYSAKRSDLAKAIGLGQKVLKRGGR